MKKRTSRIMATAVTALLAVSSFLPASVSADAWNPAGGCTINTQIKKANPANVAKDGVIGDGEYTEIAINRDATSTDCLLSWDSGKSELMESAEQFLQNVHFYVSWDDVNGVNFAVQATLLETPVNPSPMPDNDYYGAGGTFPGDEFLFQFGTFVSTYTPKGTTNKYGMPEFDTAIYRGISKNTETGEILIGHYGVHGLTGSINLVEGQNYTVAINGNTVTYEISYPLASVVEGGAVTDGTELWFTMSTTGGSQGKFHEEGTTACYCVSIGDTGYMSSKNAGDKLQPAKGTFSTEVIPGGNGGSTGDDSTGGSTGGGSTGGGSTTDGNTNGGTTGGATNPGVNPNPTNPSNNTTNTNNPKTGDAAVVLAAVSALSACGAVVIRKKRK